MRKKSVNVAAALERLARAEGAFVGTDFLAPVLRGRGVGVRIAGVRCQLDVRPRDFDGWGVFRAESFREARFLRPPTMAQRRAYLALLPAVRLILVAQVDGQWHGVPAGEADARVGVDGPAPVRFVEDAETFDTVVARFDGGQFWFDQGEARADPGVAALMRDSLFRMARPASLDRAGMTAAQRAAYAAEYALRRAAVEEDERTRDERRLRGALAHAGATLRDYAERAGVYCVTYEVDGRRHTSAIRKDDLTVVTAGICLSGQDQNFDLSSLVGVLREGEGRFRFH